MNIKVKMKKVPVQARINEALYTAVCKKLKKDKVNMTTMVDALLNLYAQDRINVVDGFLTLK